MPFKLSQHGGQPHGGEGSFGDRIKSKVLGKACLKETEEKELRKADTLTQLQGCGTVQKAGILGRAQYLIKGIIIPPISLA